MAWNSLPEVRRDDERSRSFYRLRSRIRGAKFNDKGLRRLLFTTSRRGVAVAGLLAMTII